MKFIHKASCKEYLPAWRFLLLKLRSFSPKKELDIHVT